MVGTVKKSTDTKLLRWLSKKVRQVCEGGFRWRTMYLFTLVSPMSIPSLSSSPWMRGAPHIGFSRLILRISSRVSLGTFGLPGFPCRTFQVQKSRKPLRCQATTVSGFTITRAERQSRQTLHSQTHRPRSTTVNCGRPFAERFSTPI